MLVSSVYRYVSRFDKACGISFMYCKSNKGSSIDPCGTLQFMVSASKKAVPNETKKALFVRYD